MRDVPSDVIRIQEVGMRDGLQSAGQFVETADKIQFAESVIKNWLVENRSHFVCVTESCPLVS